MNNVKKNIFGLIRAVSFLLIFCFLFAYASGIFSPKGKADSTGMSANITAAYKGETKNSIDVMAVGNSDVYRAINPIQIWENTGITTCVMGMPSITTAEIYHRLSDVFKYQSPKLVVFETDCMFSTVNKFNENGQLAVNDNKRTISQGIAYGIEKFHENFDNVEEALFAGIDYRYPLVKYNYRWQDINKDDFVNSKGKYKFIAKGFIADNKIQPFNYGETYLGDPNAQPEDIDSNTTKYFEKIVELCKKNNAQLALVCVPAGTSWNYAKHNAVQQIADKYNLTFIDYNTDKDKLNNIDWTKDTKDGGNHLNYNGSVKVSRAFAKDLTDTLKLQPSNLDHNTRNIWATDTERFYKEIVNYK